MKNFWQRALTGIIFVLAIVGGLWWHEYSYLLIFLTVVILGMLEFIEIVKVRKPVRAQVGWALFIGIFWYVSVFYVLRGNLSARWLVFIVPLLIGVFITELYRKKESPLLNIAVTLLVPFYVALPFSFLHFLAFHHGVYNYELVLGFFILIWANDTGAYLIGVSFGKHKFFPRISPKKTWEGFFGGISFTLLAGWLISAFFIDHLNWYYWLIIALIVSVMGTLGDLVESMLKRSVNLKDSGKILPGHGGVLDRFDAVIFAAPLMVSFLLLLYFLDLYKF